MRAAIGPCRQSACCWGGLLVWYSRSCVVCGKDCTVPVKLLWGVTSIKGKGLQAVRREICLDLSSWRTYLAPTECGFWWDEITYCNFFFVWQRQWGGGRKSRYWKVYKVLKKFCGWEVSCFSQEKELTYGQNELFDIFPLTFTSIDV